METDTNGASEPETNGNLSAADASGLAASAAQAPGISADEIALYDRQIRLWGVQAQERIRSANVLLITVKALGTEIAKNLILNGINSLTIIDNGIITDDDLGAQYFLRDEDVGSNRAEAATPRLQELNPRVTVRADSSDILTKSQDYYQQFDMVIATDLNFATLTLINTATRMALRPFYAAGIHGFYGFIFADLIEHEYSIEREKSNITTTIKPESATRSVIGVTGKRQNGKAIEIVTKKEMYSHLLLSNTSPLPQEYLTSRRKLRGVTPLLPALRALWEFERTTGRLPGHSREDLVGYTQLANEKLKELQMPVDSLKSDFLRSFLQNVGSEIVPTAAFVGGRLSEDVINVLGKREQPLQNTAFFDGENLQGPIYALHPIFQDDLTATMPMNGGAMDMTTTGTTIAELGNAPLDGNGMVMPFDGAAGMMPAPTLDATSGADMPTNGNAADGSAPPPT
ncbi:hypothetical protein MBLNU457_g0805t1 [Dothideomycetes sp. NU457]